MSSEGRACKSMGHIPRQRPLPRPRSVSTRALDGVEVPNLSCTADRVSKLETLLCLWFRPAHMSRAWERWECDVHTGRLVGLAMQYYQKEGRQGQRHPRALVRLLRGRAAPNTFDFDLKPRSEERLQLVRDNITKKWGYAMALLL
jgi:hypothetical protein